MVEKHQGEHDEILRRPDIESPTTEDSLEDWRIFLKKVGKFVTPQEMQDFINLFKDEATQEEFNLYLDVFGLTMDAGEYKGGKRRKQPLTYMGEKWEKIEDEGGDNPFSCPLEVGIQIDDSDLLQQPDRRATEEEAFENIEMEMEDDL